MISYTRRPIMLHRAGSLQHSDLHHYTLLDNYEYCVSRKLLIHCMSLKCISLYRNRHHPTSQYENENIPFFSCVSFNLCFSSYPKNWFIILFPYTAQNISSKYMYIPIFRQKDMNDMDSALALTKFYF